MAEETSEEVNDQAADDIQDGTEPTDTTETQVDVSWRESIKDESLRKHSERFDTVESLVKGNLDQRKKLANAVFIPGKDADPEDVINYRKAIGVPESAEKYEIETMAAEEMGEAQKEILASWQKVFYDNNIPASAAKELSTHAVSIAKMVKEAEAKADADFAKETERTLKQDWTGDEYARNVNIANQAAEKLLGEDFENARQLVTQSGRNVMDHPVFVRMFAQIGREMDEGGLGPAITGDERENVKSQIDEARSKRQAALEKGDNKSAQHWDQKERDLFAKLYGDAPI